MRRLWIFLTVLALIGPGPAPAFGQMGYAAYSCANFAEQYGRSPDATERLYFSWAQGFMFGFLVGSGGMKLEDDPARGKKIMEATTAVLSPPDFEVSAQKSFLRRYCDEHPLRMYAHGVTALLEKLFDHKAKN